MFWSLLQTSVERPNQRGNWSYLSFKLFKIVDKKDVEKATLKKCHEINTFSHLKFYKCKAFYWQHFITVLVWPIAVFEKI